MPSEIVTADDETESCTVPLHGPLAVGCPATGGGVAGSTGSGVGTTGGGIGMKGGSVGTIGNGAGMADAQGDLERGDKFGLGFKLNGFEFQLAVIWKVP